MRIVASWLSDLVGGGALNEVLAHVNRSSDATGEADIVDRADLLFRALNKLWSLFSLHQGRSDRSDNAAFAALLAEAFSLEDRRTLLDSSEAGRLAALHPPILNHRELQRSGWTAGTAIPPALRRSAAEDHRRFSAGFARYRGDAEPAGATVKKLASLLYVVRSNLAHGEKTPYGPDVRKRERDEAVCRHVVPVQELLVHLVLKRPDHKLAAYGTLVQGGRNHDRVAGLRGAWQRCFVRGSRWTAADGDPAFRWNPGEPEVAAMLLVSEDLPSAWPELDRFEGRSYRRRLVPVRGEDAHHVAYVYESAGQAISK